MWMTARRLQRRYRGVYKKDSFIMQLVTWIVVIYTLAVLAVLAFGADGTMRVGWFVSSYAPGSNPA